MTTTVPTHGGPAQPVSLDTSGKVMGRIAKPVYGFLTAADAAAAGYKCEGGPAQSVYIVSAAQLASGAFVLEGDPKAMPMYVSPAGSKVEGGYSQPVAVVGGALSVVGASQAYYQKMLSLFGSSLLRYYPVWEPSGTTLTDISANAGNGTITNVTLAQPGIGDGRTSGQWGATSFGVIYSAALNAGFTPGEFSIMGWARMVDASPWSDGTLRVQIVLRANSNNFARIMKHTAANSMRCEYYAGGVAKYGQLSASTTDWLHVAMTVNVANDRLRIYLNGSKQGADVTGLGTWSGALATGECNLGANWNAALNVHLGYLAHWCVITREATATEVASSASAFDYSGMLFVGDSKTLNGLAWQQPLLDGLSTTAARVTALPGLIGVSGINADSMAARCDADIAAMTYTPRQIIINLGANDVGAGGFNAAAWKADMEYIVNAYHAAFGSATIRLAKPWIRTTAQGDLNIAAAAVAIDEIKAARFYVGTGIDESAILPGADDGATMTTDGIHYSAAGSAAISAAWIVACS